MKWCGIRLTCSKVERTTARIRTTEKPMKSITGGDSVTIRGVCECITVAQCGCGRQFNLKRAFCRYGIGSIQMVLACTPTDVLLQLAEETQYRSSRLSTTCSGKTQKATMFPTVNLAKKLLVLLVSYPSRSKVDARLSWRERADGRSDTAALH